MEIKLGTGWKFTPYSEKELDNAWRKEFEDSLWQEVVVPHDWSVSMPFSKTNSSGTGYLPGGIGWYRIRFYLPKEMEGKSVSLVFDGIYKHSQVWCNSYYLGRWANGYTGFSFDITEQIKFGEIENVIAVKVNHSDISDSRWYTGSGINRKVCLKIKEPIHIVQDGIFFFSQDIDKDKANVFVETTIQNSTEKEAGIILENRFIDKDGKEVACFTEESIIERNGKETILSKGILKNPVLWNVNNPTCYELQTIVKANDVEVDLNIVNVGIRNIEFDSDEGFFINGESMKLKGVCLHEDAGCLGTAVPKKVWKRRLTTLKEMGCNAIRMSHNPHSQELYSLCDEMGFFVIDEIFDEWEGPKNKWSRGHNVYPPKHQGYYEDFPEWHEKDIDSFMRKSRNHPSIIMWSIGNEIDYPNDPYCHPLFQTMTGNNDANKPTDEMVYSPDRPNAERLAIIAKSLIRIVRKYDTTRPISLAAAFPELSSQIGFFDELDVVGYNYKEHLYDESHKRFPNKSFLGSENNHSYKAWQAVLDREFISGQFLWTGIDYLGEAYGWPIHGSGAGVLDLAGYPKSNYFFRKSLWNDKPMIYMVTARTESKRENNKVFRLWNYFEDDMIEVQIYTNQPCVELFLNNNSLGIKDKNIETGYISCEIPFQPGELKAVAMNGLVYDSIQTVEAECGMRVSVYDDSFKADGEDILQIEVQLVDRKSREVALASPNLFVTVTGEATLLGIENGDLADFTEYSSYYRRAYHGKLLIFIRSTKNPGDSYVTITGEGIKSETLHITSK